MATGARAARRRGERPAVSIEKLVTIISLPIAGVLAFIGLTDVFPFVVNVFVYLVALVLILHYGWRWEGAEHWSRPKKLRVGLFVAIGYCLLMAFPASKQYEAEYQPVYCGLVEFSRDASKHTLFIRATFDNPSTVVQFLHINSKMYVDSQPAPPGMVDIDKRFDLDAPALVGARRSVSRYWAMKLTDRGWNAFENEVNEDYSIEIRVGWKQGWKNHSYYYLGRLRSDTNTVDTIKEQAD
jgi:hypothetical protein